MEEYIFNEPVIEIIKRRISVRSYSPKPLEESVRENIMHFLSKINGPFDAGARFRIIDNDSALKSNIKLGTYGMIRGASSYIASAVKEEEMYLEELGYELEQFVLYATSIGLGTCWMGGSFKKGAFARAMEIEEGEILPIVTPIGYPSEKKSLLSSFVRAAAGSANRKGWEEIFFNGDFSRNLTQEEAGTYAAALEMLRLGPSASNKQPWRIVKDGDKFHFYLSHTAGYSKNMGFDMQRIDMGIAMCHFELTLKEAGIKGTWQKNQPDIKIPEGDIDYIISWI